MIIPYHSSNSIISFTLTIDNGTPLEFYITGRIVPEKYGCVILNITLSKRELMATTIITAGYDVTVSSLYIERCTFLRSSTFCARTNGDGEGERRPRLSRQVLRGRHLRRIWRISPLLSCRLQVPERRRPLAPRPVPAGGFQLHSHPLHLFIDSSLALPRIYSVLLVSGSGLIYCCDLRYGWSLLWDDIFHIGSRFMIDPRVFTDERL